ncbi:hypothetical protein HK103_007614 [Boothiomyces macroporosus]|uniref:Uncharacterized protein n=1 Tax=Boothiomyces macroporosus TaxID=261099 RepID=A0AAD5UC77_9FUNG|nr:hypothetical protein HK103_007614 [Boothiomyces macroporosus]
MEEIERETVLLGSHSKDNIVSLFLNRRTLISVDGKQWPDMAGFLLTKSDLVPIVQLECRFVFKTSVGITTTKIIYNEYQKAVKIEDGKFGFRFRFGSKALFPTFDFDQEHGVYWKVYGFVAEIFGNIPQSDNMKIQSKTGISFHVGYKYTKPPTRYCISYALNRRSSVKYQIDKLFNNTILKASVQLRNPIRSLDPIEMQIDLTDMAQHQIERIKVHLKQKIVYQAVSSTHFNFKNVFLVLDEPAPPLYTHGGKQTMVLSVDKFDLPSMAQVKGLDDPTSTLVSSTEYSDLVPGSTGLQIQYEFKIELFIKDYPELSANIPFLVSYTDLEADEAVNPNTTLLTRQHFLPILAGLIEDLTHSVEGLNVLLVEWRSYRSEANKNDRMCTESSDHAIFLLEMLDSFTSQLEIFTKHLILQTTDVKKIPWPNETVPFNMFLLELELLIRAVPHAPAYTVTEGEPIVARLLKECKLFMQDSLSVIKGWIKPVGNANEIVSNLELHMNNVKHLLFDIAEGADTELGNEEKPDPDLIEALRISQLDIGTNE